LTKVIRAGNIGSRIWCVIKISPGWKWRLPRVERKANEEEEKERTMMMCVHAFRESPKSASWAQNWVKIECCDYANQDVGSFFSLSSRRLLFTRPRSPAHHAVGFFFARLSSPLCCVLSSFLSLRGAREKFGNAVRAVKSSESCSIQA
jgi:hypothetical protein